MFRFSAGEVRDGGAVRRLLGHHPASSRGFVPERERAVHRGARTSSRAVSVVARLFFFFFSRDFVCVVARRRRRAFERARVVVVENRVERVEQRFARPSHSRHVRDARVRAQAHRLRHAAVFVIERNETARLRAFRFNRNPLRRSRRHSVPRSRRHVDGVPRMELEFRNARGVEHVSRFTRVARRINQPPPVVNVPGSAFRRRVVSGHEPGFRPVQLHGDVVVGVVVPRRLHAPLRARVHADIDVVREPKPRCGLRGL